MVNTEVEPPLFDEHTTHLVPSRPAVEGLLKLAAFDVAASYDVVGRPRTTVIARAVHSTNVRGRSDLLARVHERLAKGRNDRLVDKLSFYDVMHGSAPPSTVAYHGPWGPFDLDP